MVTIGGAFRRGRGVLTFRSVLVALGACAVTLAGFAVDRTALARSEARAQLTLASGYASTRGTLRLDVIDAAWSDQPAVPMTRVLATIHTVGADLAHESRGVFALTARPVGSVTLPHPISGCPDPERIREEAGLGATPRGVITLVALPGQDAACDRTNGDNPDVAGLTTPSGNGIVLFQPLAIGILAHELGHAFGLRHASSFEHGKLYTYDDPTSVMGGAANDDFAPAERLLLGWASAVRVAFGKPVRLDDDHVGILQTERGPLLLECLGGGGWQQLRVRRPYDGTPFANPSSGGDGGLILVAVQDLPFAAGASVQIAGLHVVRLAGRRLVVLPG
jgi:hypothetical protein